jgi:hypothetical protein
MRKLKHGIRFVVHKRAASGTALSRNVSELSYVTMSALPCIDKVSDAAPDCFASSPRENKDH